MRQLFKSLRKSNKESILECDTAFRSDNDLLHYDAVEIPVPNGYEEAMSKFCELETSSDSLSTKMAVPAFEISGLPGERQLLSRAAFIT